MIQIENKRFKGQETHVFTKNQAPAKAFTSLVEFELAFGGQVIEVDDTHIVVHTSVFGATDVVTFLGTREDMASLVRIARIHQIISHLHKNTIIKEDIILERGLNTPSFFKICGRLLMGTTSYFAQDIPRANTKASLAIFLEISESRFETFQNMPVKDLCVIAEWFLQDGPEALTLLEN